MVTDLIQRLDTWLATNRADYYSTLLPGATTEQLDDLESKFGLKLPAELRAFFQWRNGQTGYSSLQYNLMLESLDDIASSKEMLDDMIGADFEDPKWWRRGWIPFLTNGNGDHWCVDLTAEDGGTPGQVRIFYHDEPMRTVEYASVEAWLTDLVQSMEAGTLELY